jgi:hypothetical protein
MTDQDIFIGLLQRANVSFTELSGRNLKCPKEKTIEVTNWASIEGNERGYEGFCSQWSFDETGTLVGVAHFE